MTLPPPSARVGSPRRACLPSETLKSSLGQPWAAPAIGYPGIARTVSAQGSSGKSERSARSTRAWICFAAAPGRKGEVQAVDQARSPQGGEAQDGGLRLAGAGFGFEDEERAVERCGGGGVLQGAWLRVPEQAREVGWRRPTRPVRSLEAFFANSASRASAGPVDVIRIGPWFEREELPIGADLVGEADEAGEKVRERGRVGERRDVGRRMRSGTRRGNALRGASQSPGDHSHRRAPRARVGRSRPATGGARAGHGARGRRGAGWRSPRPSRRPCRAGPGRRTRVHARTPRALRQCGRRPVAGGRLAAAPASRTLN